MSDASLRTSVPGPNLVLRATDAELDAMNEWSAKQHAASGLTEACRWPPRKPQKGEDEEDETREEVEPGPGSAAATAAANRSPPPTVAEAETTIIEWLRAHVHPSLIPTDPKGSPGRIVLAGHCVHVDRAFLRRWMPRLTAFLSHRVVDVATVVERVT